MNKYLLSYQWKYPGWALVVVGAILLFFYLYFDFRVTVPVFAVFSYFIEIKYLTIIRTNIADEIIMLALLGGFFMVVFSKEKNWQPQFDLIKGKALFRALFWNTILMLFSIVFFFGQGFLGILALNLFSVYIIYLIFYRQRKRKEPL